MWIDGVVYGLMFVTRYGAVVGDRDYCFSETGATNLDAGQIAVAKAIPGCSSTPTIESKRVAWADTCDWAIAGGLERGSGLVCADSG